MPKATSTKSMSCRHSSVDASSSVGAASKQKVPPFVQRARAVNNDIRGLFPHKDFTEEQWRMVGKRVRAPFKFKDVPTQEQIQRSRCGDFFFGFYMSHQDILDFAKEFNKQRRWSPTMTSEDMYYTGWSLSLILDDWRDIDLRRVIVSPAHKEEMPEIVEEVGKPAYVACVLTTDEYFDGYNPTNREIAELAHVLEKRPFWWESYE
ncbi:hypothetical protein EIP91_001942 [Steccherinum ochraceum]|uniref:Uncharacterized protein n=1 Tax=Steccherinum ochraceum TaxID=92696 RepID=A0A4R0RJD1_9APHY|nr:hypothetical protein EIP91_001942 [Steccherinum ochraceum]